MEKPLVSGAEGGSPEALREDGKADDEREWGESWKGQGTKSGVLGLKSLTSIILSPLWVFVLPLKIRAGRPLEL